MNPRFRSATLALLMVGAAYLVLVPTAKAQPPPTITMTLEPQNTDTNPLKPLGGPMSLSGTLTYTIDSATSRGALVGVQVTYTVSNKPSWATVVVSPPTDVITLPNPSQSSTTSVSGTAKFTVQVSADINAPAFSPASIEVAANVPAGQGYQAANGKASTLITASYFSIIDVQLPETIKNERPLNTVIFPITLTNLGNAQTKVSFEITRQDQTPNVVVIPPNPVVLPSKQAGATQNAATVNLQIQTPYKNGYLNVPTSVTIRLTSAYALDPKIKGDENTFTILVTTRGFYVPGANPLALIGLVALSAVLLRRKA